MGGKTSNASKTKYNAKAYDQVKFVVKKGEREIIKAHAESKGMILSITLDTFYSKISWVTCAYWNKYSWSAAEWIFIPIRCKKFYATDFSNS